MKLAAFIFAATGVYAAALTLFRVDYECRPYTPDDECRLGAYEVRLYSHSRTPHAVAEAACVIDKGSRYEARRAWFHTRHRADFFEAALEFPKTRKGFDDEFTEICRVE